jgi:hypothetical protein
VHGRLFIKKYCSAFEDEGYDDINFLVKLSDDEVKDLLHNVGITKSGHILKIKKTLYELRNQQIKEMPATAMDDSKPVQSSRW